MKTSSAYFEQWVHNLVTGRRTLAEARRFMESVAQSESKLIGPDMVAAIQDAIDYFKDENPAADEG